MIEDSSNQLAKRSAELVPSKRRGLISSKVGTYHPIITVELVKKYGGKVVTVRDIAKVQYGRVSKPAEVHCRKMMSVCVTMLLKAGIPAIPFYEKEGRHRVMGIKRLTVENLTPDDMERLEKFKDTAVLRRDLSKERAKMVMAQARKIERKWENHPSNNEQTTDTDGTAA